MTTSRTLEHNESNRRQQVPAMPGYAEALGLRRASQRNDRQVLATPMIAHIQANASAIVIRDRRVWRGTRRAVLGHLGRGSYRGRSHAGNIMINLMRRLAIERRARAIMMVPVRNDVSSWWNASLRSGTRMMRIHSFFRLKMNRSMSAMFPCCPMAPKRGVIPM